MMDLETMDVTYTACTVAIGAIRCDLTTGAIGETYYRVVELEGQLDQGMSLNASTLYWWMNQSQGAREGITVDGRILLVDMCKSFNKWLNAFPGISPENLRLWGNGASFDNAILRHAYTKCGIEMPIKFFNDRDMRTIVGFYPTQLQSMYRKNNIRKGTHHNALDDCKHQIEYCSFILKDLGVKELY